MKAIFKSKQKYLHLSKGEVFSTLVIGEAFTSHGYEKTGEVVGTTVKGGNSEFYLFSEGADHCQLTLEDPTEIEKMRSYIERRKDDFISEVVSE